MKALRIHITFWKVVAYLGTGFFTFCFFGALASGQPWASLMFVPFIIPCLMLILCYGPISIDQNEIAMRSAFGTYSIGWSEVVRVRYAKSHIALEGRERRLILPLPSFWNGPDKRSAAALLDSFIRDEKIPCAFSPMVDFQLSKNAKKNTA